MSDLFDVLARCVRSFFRQEDGSQVITYALIIAVVALGLVVALNALTGSSFTNLIGRVNNCLATTSCV